MSVTFYNQKWCPKSQSILLALEASGLEYKLTTMPENLDHVCGENNSKTPALQCNGFTAMQDYKESIQFINKLTKQQNKGDAKLKRQEIILEHFTKYILPYFEKSIILKSPREGLDLFIEALSYLENELVMLGGKFFGGQEPNFVDFGIFPYLDKIDTWIPQFETAACGRVLVWVKNMRNNPMVSKTMYPEATIEHKRKYSASIIARNAA